MGDDPRLGQFGLITALEALRADVREDIGAMEGRVTASIEGVRREFVEYGKAHGDEHAASRAATEAVHARFDTFIRSSEISQARRDGLLGAIRFVLDVGSRNWKLLALVFGALGLALGNVHVNVGLE
ncbi:MAG TPA: hypothetical protein VJ259_04045 [Actinomycetota bacterium]|nr:hypothetical protein [Actinomycetota bacterium]